MKAFCSILSDPLIMYERKKPFANLLCWAHLITERDSLVSVATLAKSKAFWEHIQECATLIAAIKETIQEDALRIPVGHIVQVLLTQFISIPVSVNVLLYSSWQAKPTSYEYYTQYEQVPDAACICKFNVN